MFAFRSIFLILILVSEANAKDLCTLYRNVTPLPSWYGTLCNGKGGGFDGLKSVVGGAYSTFADAFSLNPASLPTVELPPGVEMVASAPMGRTAGSRKITFNAIKGFKGFGAGVGTDTENSIYSNRANTSTSSYSTYSPAPTLPSLNFASAISMDTILRVKEYYSWMPKIGALLRYNSTDRAWNPGLGVTTNLGPFSFGVSGIYQKAVGYYPATTVLTQTLGIHIFKVQLDYTLINNQNSMINNTVVLFALSGSIWKFTFNLASRLDRDYTSGGTASTYHLGIQYVFNPHFALAYLNNYIPGYQSMSAQVMF